MILKKVFSLFIISLFVGIILFFKNPVIIEATITELYDICFDYEYYNGTTMSECNTLIESKTNVLKSDLIVSGYLKEFEISLQVLGSEDVYVDPSNSQENYAGFNQFRMKINSNFSKDSIIIKDSSDNVSATSIAKVIVATLSEGKYTVTYTGSAEWNDEFNNSKSAKIICTFQMNIDTSLPALNNSLGIFNTITNNGFQVSATDFSPLVKLYYKTPSMIEFELATSATHIVSPTAEEGKYTYYAEDLVGNKSEESWVRLSGTTPMGELIKSDYDNSVYFTWENNSWTATLDGIPYIKNTWIKDEGEHIIVLKNTTDISTNYVFYIDHFYEIIEIVNPTCTGGGYIRHECHHCGGIYDDLLAEIGHHFESKSHHGTCIKGGEIIYTCNECDYTYKEANLPSGHIYITNIIKSATCKEDGIRHHTCEKCSHEYDSIIITKGHNYLITKISTSNKITRRTYTCSECGDSYIEELGTQYEKVMNYINHLFEKYRPYMVWVFLSTASIWSIAIGVSFIIAKRNEEKEKAKKMIWNYLIGLMVIFIILVACPYLIRGVASLVT